MCAGVLRESAAVRLQHMCDAVIVLEAFRDDSGIARMVSDASRCALLLSRHGSHNYRILRNNTEQPWV